jgi:hypothetical protein
MNRCPTPTKIKHYTPGAAWKHAKELRAEKDGSRSRGRGVCMTRDTWLELTVRRIQQGVLDFDGVTA